MLTLDKELPEDLHTKIWELKQQETIKIIKNFSIDYRLLLLLKTLKEEGYIIYVASNAIRESVKLMLLKTGLLEYVDYYFSNQDVKNFKPHPEIYLRCMVQAEVKPSETLILEDSHYGRTAALESGGHLCAIKDTLDVTYEKIKNKIKLIEMEEKKIIPEWQGEKDTIVLIPMAGLGSRFVNAGYIFPKPLIEVFDKPMIQLVVENLNINAKYVYIVQKEHYDKYNLKYLLNLITPNCEIVITDTLTEGAACTTLLAKEFIDNDKHLIISNSDQYVEWDSNAFMYSMIHKDIDAGCVTFEATHPKWSFARLDENGFIIEVAEKKPISNLATAGIYYWKNGSDYVKYAEQMINNNIRTNGEFYVCLVFNEAIKDNFKIRNFKISKMWGLGTPEDLNNYLSNFKS